jgi:hypothetical protein
LLHLEVQNQLKTENVWKDVKIRTEYQIKTPINLRYTNSMYEGILIESQVLEIKIMLAETEQM